MPSSKILLRNKIIRKFVSQNVIISNASVFVFKKIKHEDVNLNRFRFCLPGRFGISLHLPKFLANYRGRIVTQKRYEKFRALNWQRHYIIYIRINLKMSIIAVNIQFYWQSMSDRRSLDRQSRSTIFFPRSDRDRRSQFGQKIAVRSAIAKQTIGIAKTRSFWRSWPFAKDLK